MENRKNMTYKIAFFDIDGTILRPDHSYEDSTKDAIDQLHKKGIHVVLATGRPFHELEELAKQLKINAFIGYNGTYAVYQNDVIVQNPFDSKLIQKIKRIADEKNDEVVLYTHENNLFSDLNNLKAKTFIETFQLKYNGVFHDKLEQPILGATLVNIAPNPPSLYEIDPKIHLTPVNVKNVEGSYDIILNNVNKGTAVKKMLNYLNIPAEQSIAFGDGMNDKEMMKVVGESFAMENGHPDLFQYAKHRTTSVEESGIYNGLKFLGLIQ